MSQSDLSSTLIPANSSKLQDEINSIKRHLQAISNQRLNLNDDFNPALNNRPRKVNLPMITLAPPPVPVTSTTEITSSSEPIKIILKSLKPALTFSLDCSPTSTILELKHQLSKSDPKAPSPDSQRWLHKGKALVDNKLLKEFENIKSGETVHLMIKAGGATNPNSSSSSSNTINMPTSINTNLDTAPTPSSTIAEAGTPMAISRAASPLSPMGQSKTKLTMSIPKITMDGEGNVPVEQPFISRSRSGSINTNPIYSPHLGISESFRSVVTKDEFWVEVKKFLNDQFGPCGPGEENARQMWEHWFNSSKEWMTASEIARIREAAGISGMAGR